MPTDWLFYWMTLPSGLAVIAVAVVVPFFLWRFMLGRAFPAIGFSPLLAAYALAAVGLVGINFFSAYFEFSDRVAKDILPEGQRWGTVPGWTIYLSVLSLIAALPLLGLVAVPATAWLLKLRRLSPTTIVFAVVLLWLLLTLLAWAFPSNEWHRTHRLDSMIMWLSEIGPAVAAIALPFELGVYLTSRTYRNADA